MSIIMLTSGAVLLLVCAAFFGYEFVSFRQTAVRRLATLGEIIADNSTAALAFNNREDAAEILRAVQVERNVNAVALYDQTGKLFSFYPASLEATAFPVVPGPDGYRFAASSLSGFQPVVQDGTRRLGTLYLKSDTSALTERFRLYGLVAFAVFAVSFLASFLISRRLQRQISEPIHALAETARAVSDRRDYSVRAPRLGEAEFGLLTDAFNHMLGQIQGRDQALSESEARVRAVLDSATSAVVVIDTGGGIIDWNARAGEMFGWPREEAIGRDLADFVMPERFREDHRRGMRHFLATGEGPVLHRVIEMSALRRDGAEFPVEISISPLTSGNITTFCGFVTDVTETKREEVMRARFAAIVESSEDAIISTDMDAVITSWNHGAEKIFGYAAGEVLGQSILMLLPAERAHEESEILQSIGRGENIDHFETVRLRKDRQSIDMSVSVAPLRDRAGRVIGMSKIARDITERKASEIRLRTQFGRLELLNRITRAIGERQDLPSIFQVVVRSLEEDLPIDFGCICLRDAANAELVVNCVGARSQALASELAMGEQAHITVDQNGLSRCVRGQLVYEPDIAALAFPFPQRLARGGLRAFVAAPLLVESQVFGVLIAARIQPESFSSADCEFLRQLSEHVALAAHQAQLYTALQKAYDELRETQLTVMQQERLRVLGQMASGIAHDINNAISPVALYTESLLEKEPNLSPRARDYLGTIQRAIDDVSGTVARMREFYREREPQLLLARVALNQVVQQVIDLTRARWSNQPQERGIVIDLRTELTEDLPDIMGAEGEIRDALTNLVFNAVDAMPHGGTLTLRTRTLTDQHQPAPRASATVASLEVADTGLGMDEETRARCLEPFFTTKGERGTGLGLAMVYGMVQRHSADIEIASEPGQGTVVRLIFPVSAVVDAAAGPAVFAARPTRRLRILVVDDDPLLIKSLRDTLEDDGHIVTVADGGKAGIDAFVPAVGSPAPFDVVITDLGMPYVDGRKVASSVKAAAPATPVILLTGWGQRLIAEGDVPPHVDRVLNKPPKLHELRATLADLTMGPA